MDKTTRLNSIKNYLNLNSYKEFAEYLDVKPNTLSNWYSRNTFDIEHLFDKCPFVKPEWLITGKGDMLNEDVNYNKVTSEELIENEYRSYASSRNYDLRYLSIIISDKNGVAEYCNLAFTHYTGFTSNDLLGKKPGDILQMTDNQDSVLETIRKAMKCREKFYGEVINFSKRGKKIICELAIEPINLNGVEKFLSVAKFKDLHS